MRLTFRRVTPADRPAMLEICAAVWDGEDYLPSVFDAWVAAPGGQFTAVETEGRVVALARLARFARGEYWLEGIRVHADYRGRGIAAALHDYHLDLWRRSGEGGAMRLVTHSENQTMINLCERTGFTRIFDFTFAEAEAAAAPNAPSGRASARARDDDARAASHRFTLVAPAEAERAFGVIQRLPSYAEQHGLCDLSWKWRVLTPDYFAERIAADAVYRWGDWEGVLLTLDEAEEEPSGDTLFLQFPGAPRDRRIAFLSETRGLAHALGKTRLRWSPYARAERLDELPLAGYQRDWEEVMVCFERRA